MLISSFRSLTQCVLLSSLAALPMAAFPAVSDRITATIEGGRSFPIKGNIPHQIQGMTDQGALDPVTKILGMKLMLKQTPAQTAALEQLLEEQRDPKSPSYHKWLTPEEFSDRFGVSQADIAKLSAWLGSRGFSVQQVARARNWITFDGPAAAVESAFHTALHHFQGHEAQEGTEVHFANAVEPSVPSAIVGVVGSIRGLDDFHPRPQHTRKSLPKFNSGGYHYLAPDDMAAIYDISRLYAAGIDGTGQKLAIVGQTDFVMADITSFRSYFGLSVNPPQVVLTGSDPGINGDETEAVLDVEWSGAIARNATIIFVNSTDVFTSVLYEIDQNLAPVMSMSYGMCELWTGTGIQAWAQQANAEGITWMNSSGDSGAASCDWDSEPIATGGLAVLSPADVPEITAVGGTEFNEGSTGWSSQNGSTQASANGYLPEMGWDDAVTFQQGIIGGGGGVSVKFPKPWWQTGPGVPNDGGRDVPDLSLTASADHDGYLIYEGGLGSVGGTSASSPAFAGIVALINQYLVAQGTLSTPGLGNINPVLYSLAQNSSGVFHDVTAGGNVVPCTVGSTGCTTGSIGYMAGPGYDLATGLGSVDAYNLVMNWSSVASLVGTSTALVITPTSLPQASSAQMTATVTPASGTVIPSGTVTFTAGGNSVGTAALAPSTGTTATATVSVSGNALLAGTNTIYATFVPVGVFSSSTGSATVTVIPTSISTVTSVSASPSTVAQNATTQLTALIYPASGGTAVSGSVTFSVAGTVLGSATVAGINNTTTSAGTLTVPGSSLTLGSNTIAAAFVGTGRYLNSNGSATVAVTAASFTTTISMVASAVSIPANGTTQLTATVTPSSGSAAPTGAVAFKLGSATLGSATLVASGAGSGVKAVASLLLNGSSLAKGANSIIASYAGAGSFLGSTSPALTITTTTALPATTTTATAAPVSIGATGSTVITVSVKPASGTVAPTGSVTFTTRDVTLSTALLKVSGSTSSATLTLSGSSLVGGANIINVTYPGSSTFAGSGASVTVTLPSTAVATTTTLAASPSSMAKSGTTQLVAAIRTVSGSGSPIGSVNFTSGGASLGSASLVSGSAAGIATASLSLPGTNLAFNANVVTAVYAGTSAFSSSTGSVTLTITGGPVQTSLTATATPATLASSGTASLVATVTPASGSATPTGNVTFTLGQTALGSAPLVATGTNGLATASLSLTGTNLASGANSITVTYAGSSAFTSSSGTVTVTLTPPPPVATSLTATSSSSSIASNGTAQISIAVTPASGSSAPTGSVTFTLGQTSLGSETLSASGSKGTAVHTVNAGSLATGANTITVTYAGASAFSGSTGTTAVTVAAPVQIATSLTAVASSASIAPSGTTQLSITVTPASGSTAPTGTVAITLGQTSLGTAALTAAGSKSTAVFTLNGSSLAPGSNTITATYAGTTAFTGSTASASVTVTSTSKVVVTAAKSQSNQKGFTVAIKLQETNGVATTVTGWTINGTSFTSVIAASFGTANLAAKGTISNVITIQWLPLPNPLVFAFTGVDAGGHQWTQSASIATK